MTADTGNPYGATLAIVLSLGLWFLLGYAAVNWIPWPAWMP